ncbi:diiron oxygenase [Moraxella nonliquefaciens]|uniref:Diiron oxygenase n=1 Tax=Moraxella nonliquefaciens TaxID=478 RepID=A0A7T3F1F3_MORNO|nr:diiron oxygenase [Moraxella nonliquefaciens]QPT45359.1 diiron oxygenase [Moraxella nonliquefaciens]QQC30391.1 diiron oxygenase [Moraxella nonliquefaciens]
MKTVADMQTILKKLSKYWQQNATVHTFDGDYDDIEFFADKKDFAECLLPFANHDAWLNAPQPKKDACLSYAWILYNMKTVYIECDVVTPACENILKYPLIQKIWQMCKKSSPKHCLMKHCTPRCLLVRATIFTKNEIYLT